MNMQQIRWASTHDWFIRAEQDTVTHLYRVVARDDVAPGTVTFHTFQELRNWAGY